MTVLLGLVATMRALAQIAFRSAAQAISAIRRQRSLTLFTVRSAAAAAMIAISVLALPGMAHAAITYVASATNPADNGSLDVNPVVVAPPGGMQAGDLVILVANIREAGRTLTISATGGQAWTSETTNTTNTTQGIFWARYNGTWSANPSVANGGGGTNATTVVMHVFRPTASVNTWAVDVALTNSSFTAGAGGADKTITGISTVTPGALVFATWATPDNNTWGLQTAGWTNAGGTQYRNLDGNDSSQSAAYKIMPTAVPSGDVVNRQTANGNDAGNSAIIAFREVPPVSVVSINCSVSCAATSAPTVSWTVIFNQSVTGVDATAFALAAGGLSGAYISSVTGSGTTWTVTADTGIGAGTLGLNQTGPGSVSPILTGTFIGQVYTITATPALAEYRMDEVSWNGTANEVVDSSGSYPGTAANTATPPTASTAFANDPARTSGLQSTCRYGLFDSITPPVQTRTYVDLKSTFPKLNSNYTVTAWIRSSDITRSGQRIFVNDDANQGWAISLGDGGAGRLRVFNRSAANSGVPTAGGYNPGCGVFCLGTLPGVITNGAWYFVAVTVDTVNKQVSLYAWDSALTSLVATSTAYTGTWGTDPGATSIGGETSVSGEYPGTFAFLGNIDEVRVYQKVLSSAALAAVAAQTRTCPATINHIRIEHTGTGLTCEPATVTVKACTDVTCSLLYTGNVTTTLSPTGWVGGDTINFSGGSTTTQLRKTTVGTVALGAGTTAPAPANVTRCFNGLTETCSLDFKDTGFLFSAIPTQIAATTSATHTLQAVRTDLSTGVCTGVFTGNVPNIELASECINPGTCQAGQQVTFNNNGTGTIAANNAGPIGSWTTRTLTFGANSTANFTFSYPDVGAIRLHARYNIASSGNYMTGTTTPAGGFVVKPAGFTVTGLQRTADAFVNPGAADAAGAVFIKAGDPITLTVTGVNSAGVKTPNYGKESPAEGVLLTSALVAGLGLTNNPALGNGTIAGGAFGSGVNAGIATVTNVTWGEVGIIRITPSVGDGSYLGVGDVTGTITGNIGRFTPHNFNVASNSPMFATACMAGSFTYVGQPFGYAVGMAPELTVTARNLAGATTSNYKNTSPAAQAFFKITNTSLTGKAYTAAIGTLDASAVTAPDPAIVDNGNGTATLTFNAGTGLFFTRTTPVTPFDADISLAINVIDSDTIAYASNPARFGTATAGNGIAFTSGKAMRYGRLRLGAASGSQLQTLRVPVEAQYWNGTFWITNVNDGCTTLDPGNVGLGNFIGSLDPGETTVPPGTISLLSGRGAITLSAPGAGNNGSVDLAVNLDVTSSTTATACPIAPPFTPSATGANKAYLRGKWCGATHTKDPSTRARFGINRGSDETIYIRENYN